MFGVRGDEFANGERFGHEGDAFIDGSVEFF